MNVDVLLLLPCGSTYVIYVDVLLLLPCGLTYMIYVDVLLLLPCIYVDDLYRCFTVTSLWFNLCDL